MRVRLGPAGLLILACLWALGGASTVGANLTFYCDQTGCYDYNGTAWVQVPGAVAAQAVNDSGGIAVTETGSPRTVFSAGTDTGNLLTNDTGLSSDPSVITQVSDAKSSSGVVADANGVIMIDGTSGTLIVYTAAYNGHSAGDYSYALDSGTVPACGSDSDVFTYTLADGGTPVWSTTATLTETLNVGCPKASPSLTTTASAGITVGKGAVSDQAVLSGGDDPSGTITFTLYGPNDTTCSKTATFTSTVPISGNSTYTSASFKPTSAGTYVWTAAYTPAASDTSNNPAADVCGASGSETVIVKPSTGTQGPNQNGQGQNHH
jgi:hypothetical protein